MVEFRIDAAPRPQTVATWFEDWNRVANERELDFVLPKHRLSVSAVVLVAAMASDRRQRGLVNRACGEPAANPLAERLIRVEVQPPGVGPCGDRELLQPLTSLRVAETLASRLRDSLRERDPELSPSIERLTGFIYELLGCNVVQHSGRPETGYGYAVVDPASRCLELAFADAGVGFRASLQRNPELEGRIGDDAEASQLAVSSRITGTTSPRTNMGVGLKQLSDSSDLLAADLWIASGSALLHRRTTAGQRTNTISAIPPWTGSWIGLEGTIG